MRVIDGFEHNEEQIKISSSALYFRGVLVNKNTSQSILDNEGTPINFEEVAYDTDNFFDGISGLVIPKGVKKVKLTGNTYWAVSNLGNRTLAIIKNGTAEYAGAPISRQTAVGTLRAEQNISSAVIEVQEGDYFQLRATQTSGVAITLQGSHLNWFSLEVIE